ncbi:MBOAT family O-acyltransferase [Zhouia sp. PK063]|uniref:MBOAT family O-acyltransferase n=1 Tax=Zhouia sp. PK063 TaxID=3373602 RepID=UPI0037A47ECF
MFFNSIEFVIFLPVVFLLYWFVFQRNLKQQNLLLLLASYVFYGWWDWRFLSLIIFSTLLDYSIGRALLYQQKEGYRKALLWTSILINLGFLGFFKYYNFFIDNFVAAFTFFGHSPSVSSLNIILPVGISFYTFQTLSYTIDVYKKKLAPELDFVSFATFVSFFPQLVAGPIERATNLLPQFPKKRFFDYSKAVDGMRQILWGLFKKVVIADNSARLANLIFNNSESYSGSTLVLGAIFFTFQIYGDFSGYSDIAIGTSRLFGFDLKRNFAYPYFSRDIAEFWRRWHISLSTWFRDYLYIPLGGSKGGLWMKLRNTFIIFLVSGFWHGANWTFIFWGGLNALYFLPLLLSNKNRNHIDIIAKDRMFPNFKEVTAVFTTFCLTVLAWIFFRAENLQHAFQYLSGIFSKSLFTIPNLDTYTLMHVALTSVFIFFFMLIEWLGRDQEYAIAHIDIKLGRKAFYRWSFYSILWTFIFIFSGNEQEFIYFQF